MMTGAGPAMSWRAFSDHENYMVNQLVFEKRFKMGKS
jgi:hypothetical protein